MSYIECFNVNIDFYDKNKNHPCVAKIFKYCVMAYLSIFFQSNFSEFIGLELGYCQN